jgi:hypothetical protein
MDLRIVTLVNQNQDLQRQLDQSRKDQDQMAKEARINEDLTSIRDLLEDLVQSNQVQRNSVTKVNQDLTRISDVTEHLQQLNQDVMKEIIDLRNLLIGLRDDDKQREIEKLNIQVNSFRKDREDIYHSYSWKIGRSMTKFIDFLFGWIFKF